MMFTFVPAVWLWQLQRCALLRLELLAVGTGRSRCQLHRDQLQRRQMRGDSGMLCANSKLHAGLAP
ncbi:hypothetical protein PF003_g7055 [Phytophthora fragariae]|nr:hypothetical protein PF003_g7055 [Phytophthora fragariae]